MEIPATDLERAFAWFQISHELPQDTLTSLKDVRNARQMSMSMVAQKIGTTTPAYSKLERASSNRRLSIRQMERIAEALDCHLVYYFKSKSGASFNRDLWTKLLPFALEYPAIKYCPKGFLIKRLASVVLHDCLPDPEIRRRLRWARKKYVQWPRYLRWNRQAWPHTVTAATAVGLNQADVRGNAQTV